MYKRQTWTRASSAGTTRRRATPRWRATAASASAPRPSSEAAPIEACLVAHLLPVEAEKNLGGKGLGDGVDSHRDLAFFYASDSGGRKPGDEFW